MKRRRKKLRPIPKNWDDEPDVVDEPGPGHNLEQGDIIELAKPLTIDSNEDSDVDGHLVAVSPSMYHLREHKERFYDATNAPLLDGERYGVYAGQQRLKTTRITNTSKHWTSHRRLNEWAMYHICVFRGRRIIVPLEYIKKVQ